MNIPLLIGGIVGTLFIGMFLLIAAIDGFKMALWVIGFVSAILAASAGITFFWLWVAGGFA